jgi:hypothetical protein
VWPAIRRRLSKTPLAGDLTITEAAMTMAKLDGYAKNETDKAKEEIHTAARGLERRLTRFAS